MAAAGGALGRLRHVMTAVTATSQRQRQVQPQQCAAAESATGPTAAETFLFDLQGFILLPAVLTKHEAEVYRTRLYEL
jgi:hypothetical protein